MPAAFKRCVSKIGAKKGIRSAYAICTAANAGGIQSYRKKEGKRGKKKK